MSNGLGLAPRYCGRWHVVYSDGERSQGMSLGVALGYKRIFNALRVEGKVLGFTIRF